MNDIDISSQTDESANACSRYSEISHETKILTYRTFLTATVGIAAWVINCKIVLNSACLFLLEF